MAHDWGGRAELQALAADAERWVMAAERAYVAAATRPQSAGSAALPADDRSRYQRAIAAAGAVASRFLAVGTPRSFGIVIDGIARRDARWGESTGSAGREGTGTSPDNIDSGALALAAHRTWFDPRDIRCAGAPELAAATGGRLVSVDEALACDIVCVVGADIRVEARQLRRGTHVNLEVGFGLDRALHDLARVVTDDDLPAIAGGLVDGRQLDEITIYAPSHPPLLLALEEFSQAT